MPDRPVLVLGAAGQLGQAMVATCARVLPTVARGRSDLDLTKPDAVLKHVRQLQPSVIINCAGYNQVDQAEDEPGVVLEANAFAVRTLARAARETGAVLVHYSSDFIFNGETDRPYTEESRPSPQSVYAASKLLGEWFAAEVPTHYVLRIESLFGGVTRRKSSLDTIIERIAAGSPVPVFVDRVVSPSYAWDVAEATVALLGMRPAAGIYHCVNTGAATWHDVACEAARQLGIDANLQPIRMKDVSMRASRPRYCALSNEKLRGVGISMPAWQDALGRAIKARAVGTA